MAGVKSKIRNKPKKKLDKSKTYFITSCAFLDIRFGRNLWLLGTEVWTVGGIADILAINKSDMLLEFEVKISCADINKERKKKKHFKDAWRLPNYFTLVIPNKKSLYKCALRFVEEVNPKYGIMTVSKDCSIRIKRKARKVNTNEPPGLERLKKRIFQRATSELATLRKNRDNIKGFEK